MGTESNPNQKKLKKLTIFQSIAIGSTAAIIEVFINHPLSVIKTRQQCHHKFTLNPKILYRGVFGNAASMVPMVTVQVACHNIIQKSLMSDSESLTQKQRFISAFLAGCASAFVAAPTELILIKQLSTTHGFYRTAIQTIKHFGIKGILVGFSGTAFRIAIPACGLLVGVPIFKTSIEKSYKNDFIASLIAGSSIGAFSALITQPLDTIKTTQQNNINTGFLNMRKAAKNIYSTDGIYGFFRGGFARVLRVTSAVTILSYTMEKLENFLHRWDEEKLNKPIPK